MRIAGYLLVLSVLSLRSSIAATQGVVHWADFSSSLPTAGSAATVPLGIDGAVDVLVNTGGTQQLTSLDFGNIGSSETGLPYTNLEALSIFNGGGATTVLTTVTLTGFQPSSGHVRAFLMLGAINGKSSPVTVTTIPGGIAQVWNSVGGLFPIPPSNSSLISWLPASGNFVTAAPVGNDSKGIVVDVGSLSQYESITVSLHQWLDDGIGISLGEETCPQAIASARNGGTNPASYMAEPIIIAGIFAATVDNNMASQLASILFAFDSPISQTLGGGQMLLCFDGGSGELFTGGALAPSFSIGDVDSYMLPVPNNPVLCGMAFCSQAIQFGNPPFVLSNAQDLTIGGF